MAWFEAGKPIKVEGGLKARSQRGSIGSAWWSRRFIDILERICDKGRLSRGRAYARKGQVLSIDLSAGEVTAAVQGSRPDPYEVVIRIEAYGEARWAAIEESIAAQAVYRARLLAGEMPTEIEELFAALGADLFPRDLDMDCSCPDWGSPASTCRRCSTCWPSRSTTTRSWCWPGAGAPGSSCSARWPTSRRRTRCGWRTCRSRTGWPTSTRRAPRRTGPNAVPSPPPPTCSCGSSRRPPAWSGRSPRRTGGWPRRETYTLFRVVTQGECSITLG
ncbi:hypothetical protein ACFQQB_03925 [Nonomuraea rubra]|uniref:SWIM zinc finger family protein n=1 Tax=Nonomuraea rubra TaxID=46180 RepID=UPI003623A1AF